MAKPGFWALLALTAVLVACSGGDGDSDEPLQVRLGVVQSLSGEGDVYGRSGVQAIELALSELGSQDLRFEYSVVDDESSEETGVEAYEAFVEAGVSAIVGPSLSRVGFPAIQVAQDAEVPAISPMTSASGIGAIGDYVFRIVLAEDAAIPPMIEYVSRSTPIDQAALFFDGADAYSVSAALAARAGLEAIGAEVLVEVDLSGGQTIEDVLAAPELAEADVILLPLLSDTAAPVLTGLQEAGLEQPVIGGEALATLELVELVGDAADGMYMATTWHPEVGGESSSRFVDAYREAYGTTPDYYAAVSYASIEVLVDALRRADSADHDDLRDALAATEGLNTVLGTLSISPSGDAAFPPVFQQFRDGDIVVLE